MALNILISFKQKLSAAKEVQLYISELNTEIIDGLKQHKYTSTETADQYRKKTQTATQRDPFT